MAKGDHTQKHASFVVGSPAKDTICISGNNVFVAGIESELVIYGPNRRRVSVHTCQDVPAGDGSCYKKMKAINVRDW